MVEALKRTRSGHLGTITRTENSVTEILEKEHSTITLLEISQIKCSLERCREQVSKIEELNERIINELTESDTISERIEAEKSRIDDNDLRIKTTIKALEMAEERIKEAADAAPRQPQTVTEDSQQTSTSGLKLPKLSLPTFTGKYSEWTPFSDTFNSTVDSYRTLSKIQKLHYLKSSLSLKDEPARLLSHLPTSSANYEVAKKLLQDRYANKRMIIHTHLEAIFDFRPIREESPDMLRKLISNFMENTMALQGLGLDVGPSDFISVHIIAKNLDTQSRRQWELHSHDAQSMDSLKQFLEDRARALEASASSSKLVKKNQESNKVQCYQGSTASVSCINCSEGYELHQCDKFKIMSYEDKQKFIKTKKLCLNCSRPGHNSKACKSKSRCQKCQKLHHTPGEQTEQIEPIRIWVTRGYFLRNTSYLQWKCQSSKTGIAHKCRTLLDNGSELTFISEDYLQRLQLKRLKFEIIINGIGCYQNQLPVERLIC